MLNLIWIYRGVSGVIVIIRDTINLKGFEQKYTPLNFGPSGFRINVYKAWFFISQPLIYSRVQFISVVKSIYYLIY